ncbi:MAG TPA: response regulator [Gemmatimonadales bacterium]|nr:response regulator [Gemmatimonadales bacterium]
MNRTPPLVLLADDDAQLRGVLQRGLEREGYRVLATGSAETAYELLGSERADAVLLDVRMPTMSGLALYLAIVNRWPALEGRVAIMTDDAEAGDVDVRPWLERNPCAVLRKPCDLGEVSAWLRLVTQVPIRERVNG